MNIIKKVVVFVMGLVVIGVVATTIGVVTQPKNVEKSVTFKILTETAVTNGTYNAILLVYNDNITVKVNNDIVNVNSIVYDENTERIILSTSDGDEFIIYSNDTYFSDGVSTSVNDILTYTFEVEVGVPIVVKTLLLLTPLILSASLIGYLSLSTKKGD